MNKNLILGLGILLLGIVGFLLYHFWLISTTVVGGFIVYLIIDRILDILERHKIKGFSAISLLTLAFSIVTLSVVLFVAIPLVGQLHT